MTIPLEAVDAVSLMRAKLIEVRGYFHGALYDKMEETIALLDKLPVALNERGSVSVPDGWTGWLIEELWISPLGGGTIYVHRDFNHEKWRQENERRLDPSRRRQPFCTKDANETMRFASEADARAWMEAQPRFIRDGQYEPREHQGQSAQPLPAAQPREPITPAGGGWDLGRIAKSLAGMVTEYVEGDISGDRKWRNGLDVIIERRLQRLIPASGGAVSREEIDHVLSEAWSQIDYLHRKFKETGSGNAALATLRALRDRLALLTPRAVGEDQSSVARKRVLPPTDGVGVVSPSTARGALEDALRFIEEEADNRSAAGSEMSDYERDPREIAERLRALLEGTQS